MDLDRVRADLLETSQYLQAGSIGQLKVGYHDLRGRRHDVVQFFLGGPALADPITLIFQ